MNNKWIARMEIRYGKYALHNLTLGLVFLNAAVFVMGWLGDLANPGLMVQIISNLSLIPEKVFQGQVWRLITFLFIPTNSNLLFMGLALYFFYFVGTGLERHWGAFRYNLYYFIGALATIAVGLVSGVLNQGGYPAYITATNLNLSLFLAFATLYPNMEILLFFIIPVKVKWLGLLEAVLLGYGIIQSLVAGDIAGALSVVVCFLNYLLFFGNDFLRLIHLKRHVHSNRRRFFDEINQVQRERERQQEHDRNNVRKFK